MWSISSSTIGNIEALNLIKYIYVVLQDMVLRYELNQIQIQVI